MDRTFCQSMNYQALNIGQDIVRTGWCLSTTNECSTVVLQGFDVSTLTELHVNRTIQDYSDQDNKIDIPTQALLTTSNQPLAFRLVAVLENGTICSNEESKVNFYRFDCKCSNVATMSCL